MGSHVPQETLNFRAVAYYQGEICVYLHSKLDADVLHFSIDRDLDAEFKECWAKQMMPTPKLLARCPRQLKRGQKFPPSRKDPSVPADAALAALLPIADHIGLRLQYSHQGALPLADRSVLAAARAACAENTHAALNRAALPWPASRRSRQRG